MSGRPLDGIRILDFSFQGPGPYATMIMADHGAQVLRVVRPSNSDPDIAFFDYRKSAIRVDLKDPRGTALIRRIVVGFDVVVEAFRPGTMERLGLGPDDLRAVHPGLVYVRVTGWGQDGPRSREPGHDINYIAVAGVLGSLGGRPPAPPLALVGDYAAGGLFAVIGCLLALRRRDETGEGATVDAAMLDGVTTMLWSALAREYAGERRPPGRNLIDGGAPFYRAYECADGRWFALGAMEPKFYANALDVLGIDPDELADQLDEERWPEVAQVLAERFRQRTRDEWAAAFEGRQACGTPVLTLAEIGDDPQVAARRLARRGPDGRLVSSVAVPRFDATPELPERPTSPRTHDARDVLLALDLSPDEADELIASGVVGRAHVTQPPPVSPPSAVTKEYVN